MNNNLMKNLLTTFCVVFALNCSAQKITALPAAGTLTGSELGNFVQSGANKKVRTDSIAAYINRIYPATDTASLSNRINLKLNKADTAGFINRNGSVSYRSNAVQLFPTTTPGIRTEISDSHFLAFDSLTSFSEMTVGAFQVFTASQTIGTQLYPDKLVFGFETSAFQIDSTWSGGYTGEYVNGSDSLTFEHGLLKAIH